jgi:hypothetical protein
MATARKNYSRAQGLTPYVPLALILNNTGKSKKNKQKLNSGFVHHK